MPIVYPITSNRNSQMPSSRKLFVNIRVDDLDRSKAFFGALGFAFNAKFTDDNAACMIVSDDACLMLLTDPFFRRFTDREPADVSRATEAIYAFSCDSRADVDDMTAKAMAAGASPAMPAQDHGFMYGTSFRSPDGHHFELFWMDPATIK